MSPDDRIPMTENWYEDKAPKRDARLAETYKQSDQMDRVEQINADTPDKITPLQRMALGHYVAAREAAQRVGGGA